MNDRVILMTALKSLLCHLFQSDSADFVFRDAGKLVKDGIGDPVDRGVRKVEGHPGLALGDFAADPGGGIDGAAPAADDDPFAVGDPEAFGVFVMYFDEAFSGNLFQAGSPHGDSGCVVLVEDAAGAEDEGIFFVRELRSRSVGRRIEEGASSGGVCRIWM